MQSHLLLLSANLEPHLARLEERCMVHRYYADADRDRLLATVAEDIRVVATNGHIGCSAAMMARLPNLALIGCFGVGTDAIDLTQAAASGIAVTNTPDVLTDAVAEFGVGLMLALARNIPRADAYLRAGDWHSGDLPLTGQLAGKTAGIVGLGRIGGALAQRLQAMQMRVVYHGRRQQPHQPYAYFADLESMAAASDWLVVCLPGGAGTTGLISAAVLDALGKDGFLVNIARGSVVDEPALCDRIANNALGGAALDVFAHEPSVPEVLLQAENVILTPHIASATATTRHAMGELVIDNIIAHLDGRPLLTPVA